MLSLEVVDPIVRRERASSSCWLWQKISIHNFSWGLNWASRAHKNSWKLLYFPAWLMNMNISVVHTRIFKSSLVAEAFERRCWPCEPFSSSVRSLTITYVTIHVCISNAILIDRIVLDASIIESTNGSYGDSIRHRMGWVVTSPCSLLANRSNLTTKCLPPSVGFQKGVAN